jgi:hypothetical protein
VIETFHRIKRLPPYVFAEVNRLKAAARAGGADIIDLGMGNPDLAVPRHIIEKMTETVGKPRTDRYSASKGIPGLLKAQAGYYGRRFGVKLNGAGDHGAGRRRTRAESELSDPRLRFPDGGRRHPLRAVRADAGILRRA